MANCEHVNKLSVDSGSIFFGCCNDGTAKRTVPEAGERTRLGGQGRAHVPRQRSHRCRCPDCIAGFHLTAIALTRVRQSADQYTRSVRLRGRVVGRGSVRRSAYPLRTATFPAQRQRLGIQATEHAEVVQRATAAVS
jgi:hypothetical protein